VYSLTKEYDISVVQLLEILILQLVTTAERILIVEIKFF